MSTAAARSAHAKAILGPEFHQKLANTNVLLVGAGGIGCELLKNIVLTGFGKITLLDLDTIDISNLNRQFLFKKKDVKQSKAMVAAQTAGPFNPNVKITPIHDNIKEPQYDIKWFQQYDIVLNALDNLDARRHVNKMCMAAQVPLVESGTAGYLGQVQPLLKDTTECFDCAPRETPKTFHQLFGEDEDATGELDEALKQGENAQEIATLRKEAQAFKNVRDALRSKGANDAAQLCFQKVFNADIKNLLIMKDMWKSRPPPTPLDFEAILDGRFNPQTNSAPVASGSKPAASTSATVVNGHTNGAPATSGLKDQRSLSLKDNLELFVSSTNRLAARLRSGEETISFDKDDDDTLDFVTASSNMRSYAYGIPGKTRWEVKEMAGNIIPAIATTNAIISGLIVLQALHILKKSYGKLRNVHIQIKPSVPLSAIRLSQPNPECGICRDLYAAFPCDPSRTLLGDVVKGILGDSEREVSVFEDKRLLSDPDWEDNFGSTLESLNVTRGKYLSIVDEEGDLVTISLALTDLPANHSADDLPYILPSPCLQPPRRVKVPIVPETPVKAGQKRPLPVELEDGVLDLAPTPKKPKTLNGSAQQKRKFEDQPSPSKRRRLDEDGLVLMEGPNEVLDDPPVGSNASAGASLDQEVILIDIDD